MRSLVERLSKAPNYIRRFGMLDGLRLLHQIDRDLPVKAREVREYSVPGFPAPIRLRESLSDHATFWQCLVQNQYDARRYPQNTRLAAAYREQVARGARPLIIDCGANIGLASLWFATQFPEAMVYSVEPDADNFAMLEANAASFEGRITPLRGGIWHERAALRIANPTSGAAALRVTADAMASGDTIPAHTIDDVCALAGVASPFIVKVDIEGAQKQLFGANTGWLANAHLVVIELDDWQLPWQGTSRPFLSCVSRYPFDYLLGGENVFCFRDFDAAPVAPAAGAL